MLGYHLTLTNTAELKFDRKTVVEKLNKVGKLRDSIYQYTSNRKLRFKIYQIYLAPYVELYLPIVVQSADKNSEVHKFQHGCLTRAIGVCRSASRTAIENKLKLLSVDEKAIRMAKRISSAGGTKDIQENAKRTASNSADVISQGRTLRSGKVVEGTGLARVNNNFIVRLNRLADSMEKTPEIVNNKFDMKKVLEWVDKVNKTINERIRQSSNLRMVRARARVAVVRTRQANARR